MLIAYQASTQHTAGETNLAANVTAGADKSRWPVKLQMLIILILQDC